MTELAAQIRQRYGVEIIVETIDLSEPGSAVTLQQRLDRRGMEPGNLSGGHRGRLLRECQLLAFLLARDKRAP
jgi:hypothetical protein